MPIRNPFRKTLGDVEYVDDNSRGGATGEELHQTKGNGSRPIDIRPPMEYKLSEISDGGVYLPPSPPESKRSFWQSRSTASTTSSSNHRSLLSDNEPFSISRESFDSYRRSFDISARSPMPDFDARARQSLDSRPSVHRPRTSIPRYSIDKQDGSVDEGFEEVGLDEEPKPKKRGLFSFGEAKQGAAPSPDASRPSSGHHGFFTGRRRGQSGQGAELGQMNRPRSSHAVETQT